MKKEYDFKKLEKAEPKYMKHLKTSVTMRLDPNVIGYFKQLAEKTGIPYQSLMNYVLKDYASHGLEPSANWPAADNEKKASG
jgi:predicted DNA binding CopG/RHH family protein